MFPEATCIKLIKEVEKRPALYNYICSDYRNKFVLQKLWDEVGVELDLPGSSCKWKWNTLRKSYTRVLREGNSNGGFWLGDHMEFLYKFIGHITINGSLLDRTQDEEVKKNRAQIEDKTSARVKSNLSLTTPSVNVQSQPSFSPVFLPSPSVTVQSQSAFSASSLASPSLVCLSQPSSSKLIKNEIIIEDTSEPFFEEIQSQTEKFSGDLQPNINNPIIKFVQGILPDINKLSERKKRKFKQDVLISLIKLIDSGETVC